MIAALDGDGEMAPPDAEGTVIDMVDDSLSEAVRPAPTLLAGELGCDETVLSDLDRSWRRCAEERWTVLGDLLPTSRCWLLAVGGTGILRGGGAINGGGSGAAVSSFSLDTENLRGEMFKLATLFVTYCCNALKKLIFNDFSVIDSFTIFNLTLRLGHRNNLLQDGRLKNLEKRKDLDGFF